MPPRRFTYLLSGVLLAACPLPLHGAQPTGQVELDVAFEKGFPFTAIQRWNQLLSGVGARQIRLRQANPGDTPAVKTVGRGGSKMFKVTALLTRGQFLIVPGGKFSRNDRDGVRQWIAHLKDEGQEGVTAPRGAFGLTGKQLEEVHAALKGPVAFSTKDQPARTTLNRIARSVKLNVNVSRSALKAIPSQEPVLDELKGLSQGTAMATILRPFGLVMAPRRPQGGSLEIYISDSRDVEEAWPIGWPPQTAPREVMPDLFKFINVEIRSKPLPNVLSVVCKNIKAPYLLDQNSMARHGVEPESVKVSLPKKKTYYKKIIDTVLHQAKLKAEIRLDEVDKPFLWITTIRQ